MRVMHSSWWLAPACALALVAGCREATSPPAPQSNNLPIADSATLEGVDRAALATLISHAQEQHSEAVVILRHGKIVYENYFGFANEPIYAMSASKSFVSLAIGLLLGDGKLGSLDDKVEKQLAGFTFHDPRKADITYRQLLSQTSGIDPARANMQGDIEWTAIQAGCVFPPGAGWQYSNGGIDLLGDLAGHLAGKPMDQYLNEKLFAPLGIPPVDWARDSKGVPFGAGEMKIRPMDMAKVGQMLLDGGKWNGKQVVPASYVAAVSEQSNPYEPTYGLLWWRGAPVLSIGVTSDLVAQWKGYGLSDDIAAKLTTLVGTAYPSWAAYVEAVRATLTRDQYAYWANLLTTGNHIPYSRNLAVGPMGYYVAAGWLGQFLVIVPDKGLVGVRMRRNRTSDYSSPTEVDGYPGFAADVVALVH